MVCCVLLSFSAKAQQAFSPFPKAKDKYWQKQVPAFHPQGLALFYREGALVGNPSALSERPS